MVLLSASATPGEELLRWQTANAVASIGPGPGRVMKVLRIDLAKKTEQNRQKIKSTTTDVARIGGQKVNAKWYRELMASDPREDLNRIVVPVLAVTGSKDLQVKPSDLSVIAETVGGLVEVHEVPDVSHILRPQPGEASLSGYKTEVRQPVDARVISLVVEWVQGTVGAGVGRLDEPTTRPRLSGRHVRLDDCAFSLPPRGARGEGPSTSWVNVAVSGLDRALAHNDPRALHGRQRDPAAGHGRPDRGSARLRRGRSGRSVHRGGRPWSNPVRLARLNHVRAKAGRSSRCVRGQNRRPSGTGASAPFITPCF